MPYRIDQVVMLRRNRLLDDLRQRKADNDKRLLDLEAQIKELKMRAPGLAAQLARAALPISLSKCPDCQIIRGTNVDLVPVGRPDDGDPEADYVRCADRCGFDNLP